MKYYPILLSKASELTAISNLSQAVKDEVSPIIEVLHDNLFYPEKDKKTKQVTGWFYDTDFERFFITNWSFPNNQILFDFSYFNDVHGSLTHIKRFLNNLRKGGVNAIPVVSFNSDKGYISLVQNLITTTGCKVCVRLNDSNLLNININIVTFIKLLGVGEGDTILLFDFGYINATSYNLAATLACTTISALITPKKWFEIIVSSGSFPVNLTILNPPTGNNPAIVYKLKRFEWDMWNIILSQSLPVQIKYGDFGTKHPNYIPTGQFEGSSSIKYTITDDFLIYRGTLASLHGLGGGQYNVSSRTLIGTSDYCGQNFSYGDEEIYAIGNRSNRPGNPGIWVKISQNHHVTLLGSVSV